MRRSVRKHEQLLAFDAIRIEGGLLAAAWLAKVARLEAPGQASQDYRVHKSLSLRDEIGRYWRIAQDCWSDFESGRRQKGDPLALSERFVTELLREALGFAGLQRTAPVAVGDRSFPIGHATFGGRVPVIIAPPGEDPRRSGLDTAVDAFADGARKRGAFGLLQEYLNAADGAQWGLCSDGLRLRVARDNQSLTRPAWIEADLARIFTEERYTDFAALWLLCHETRFARAADPDAGCPLEAWRSAGRAEGERARETLRDGVKAALLELGQGFLSHPTNSGLRAALERGQLSREGLKAELLRLVYRIIFLLTVEERDLLHPRGTPKDARQLYEDGYALRRLRERSVRRSAHDAYGDLWDGTRVVFRAVSGGEGERRLGLPALAGIFAPSQCPHLDACALENRALLRAMFYLAWIKDRAGLVRVNWRDMGPEELGSVYESLLELVPRISLASRTFDFVPEDASQGNDRKKTGSYYTPDELVQVLLNQALEPVIRDTIAAHPRDPARALLKLSVVDPACGSGHFLLAAARRLAGHVARVSADGTPTQEEYQKALRKVVGRCIYGVDLNPLAVELCKVALWMEAVDPGQPLTFLDAHIQHGNALIGATSALLQPRPDVLEIPGEAWAPLSGDDRKVASSLKKRNQDESKTRPMTALWSSGGDDEAATVRAAFDAMEEASDETAAGLADKESRWDQIQRSGPYQRQRFVADAWCAAFVWPKPAGGGPVVEAAPTLGLWRDLRDGRGRPSERTVATVEALARQYHFFHWHLAFPGVFQRGGFDVVLGNPPWERVKLQEQEFFATRSDEIASAPNAAARKRLIAALPTTNPGLWEAWSAACREAEGQSHFSRQSGRYPLCGKGDVNTYALFAEHNRDLLAPRGRAGFIVPTGIATDDTTKDYFAALVAGRELSSIYSFENEEFVFPAVHHAFKFALLAIDRSGRVEKTDLVFFVRQVAALADQNRHFTLSPADFATLNPNTRTCPTFRSKKDADINLSLYRRAGVLWREGETEGNPWGLRFMAMLHMANDSGLFRTQAELEAAGYRLEGNRFVLGEQVVLPLIEAKMVHQFDHRFGTYQGQTEAGANQGKLPELDDAAHADPELLTLPRYWVDAKDVESRLEDRWSREWLLGWRDICRSTDQRTSIASLIPLAATGDTFLLAMPSVDARSVALLYANLCSFALDYAARQKVGGTHLKYHTFKQLPVLGPQTYAAPTPWSPPETLRDWLLPRVLELTCTAWDLQPFAEDCGYDGPPFRWDPARRPVLRAELDAAFFHLYGLSRDEADYILDTFPTVRKNDEKEHNEYRTKRLILERYDALAEATKTGTPYRSPLDPPPADPRVAHPARSEGELNRQDAKDAKDRRDQGSGAGRDGSAAREGEER